MHIWAVANQKGGVGKTTTTVALASLLARDGCRVLMLDLDAQGSLSSYFGHDPETIAHSSFDLFKPADEHTLERARQAIVATPDERLFLLPASTALATLERQAVAQGGMGLAVSRALAQLWEDYDFVLIDSPPTLGVLLINALAAAEQLLIPVQTEFLAIKGLERMMHTLGMVTKSRRKPLKYLIVPTLFDRRTQAGVGSLRQLRLSYDKQVWHSAIPVDTRLRDASARGVTPVSLDPQGRGVRAYSALLKTLLSVDATPVAEQAHG